MRFVGEQLLCALLASAVIFILLDAARNARAAAVLVLVAVAVAQASPATEQGVAPSPIAPGPADHPSEAQDWLDETLAAPMRPSIPPEPAAVAPAPAPASSATAEPPPPAPGNIGLDKPQPTEIGRYVSAGTTYVMYSDGSIEAENESGVLRFPSMAALKAYIERQG